MLNKKWILKTYSSASIKLEIDGNGIKLPSIIIIYSLISLLVGPKAIKKGAF